MVKSKKLGLGKIARKLTKNPCPFTGKFNAIFPIITPDNLEPDKGLGEAESVFLPKTKEPDYDVNSLIKEVIDEQRRQESKERHERWRNERLVEMANKYRSTRDSARAFLLLGGLLMLVGLFLRDMVFFVGLGMAVCSFWPSRFWENEVF